MVPVPLGGVLAPHPLCSPASLRAVVQASALAPSPCGGGTPAHRGPPCRRGDPRSLSPTQKPVGPRSERCVRVFVPSLLASRIQLIFDFSCCDPLGTMPKAAVGLTSAQHAPCDPDPGDPAPAGRDVEPRVSWRRPGCWGLL